MHNTRLILFLLCFATAPAWAQFRNIRLDERTNDNLACEPAIAINPKNALNIVAASAKDNVYYTFDGGNTWTKQKMNSPYGVYGDPVLISDAKGTFYYFHLSGPTGEGSQNEKSLDAIVCQISHDGGKTWDGGNPVGLNPPKDQRKPWACVDPKGNIVVTWTQFDKYASDDPSCQSHILLSTSSNGKKWSKPLQISNIPGDCIDDDNSAQGAMPVVSDDKKMFVTWAHKGTIYLDRSFDNGNMWLSSDISVGTQPGGWNLKVPGHDRCNGLPMLAIDRSRTTSKGLLYLAWADQRNGEDDTDIWFMRSNNFGDYWSTPLKIGGEQPKRHQYLPAMTIDNATGYIYILYYDRGAYDDNQTDVVLAWSRDNGTSFKTVKISETPFVPDEAVFFGDHLNVAANKGVITPVWTRMDDGQTSVWTAVIRQEELTR